MALFNLSGVEGVVCAKDTLQTNRHADEASKKVYTFFM
jgi:hypothetical protein